MNNSPHISTPATFTVASHLSPAVWTFTDSTGPHAARLYYAEVNRVPLESVSVGHRVAS